MHSVRSGILSDSFDPVRIEHIRLSLEMKTEKRLNRVFLILQSSENGTSFHTNQDHRWKMLVAACAAYESLVPVLFKSTAGSLSFEEVSKQMRRDYPEDAMIPLSMSAVVTDYPDYLMEPALLCPSVREYCSLLGLYGQIPSFPEASKWTDMLFQSLTSHRFAHSLSVALTSKQLAGKYGIDEIKAEKAGLLHDCAKCLPLSEMQAAAKSNRLANDPLFFSSASLLHSVAGAAVAEETYHVIDPEILDAIAFHNTGFPGMSPLAMCVCLADFIEPDRKPFPGLDEIRSLADTSLEKALLLSLERTADHVRSGGKILHSRTLNTIAWLKTLRAVKS